MPSAKKMADVFSRKSFQNAFLNCGPTLTVDSCHSGLYTESNMLDDNSQTMWHSGSSGEGWIEIKTRQSILLKSVIITRRQDCCQDRYYNVCLYVDDNATEARTKDEYGNPLLYGEELWFSIKPQYVKKEKT